MNITELKSLCSVASGREWKTDSKYPPSFVSNLRITSKDRNSTWVVCNGSKRVSFTTSGFGVCDVTTPLAGVKDALKAFPNKGEVEVVINGNLTLTCAGMTIKLPIDPVSDKNVFPDFLLLDSPSTSNKFSPLPVVTIGTKTVLDLFERITPFTSYEDYRPAMNHVCLDFNNHKIAATNGHIMAVETMPESMQNLTLSSDRKTVLIAPVGVTLKRLGKCFDATVEIRLFDTHMVYSSGTWDVSVNNYDADFPPYEKIIPGEVTFDERMNSFPLDFVLNAEKLAPVVKVSNPATKACVFTVLSDRVLIGAMSTNGEESRLTTAIECVPVVPETVEPVQAAFNGDYLLDCLNFMGGEQVLHCRYENSSVRDCAVMRNENRIALVMPVRMSR
jgi:DNA polymerase III sliding clamp (beta) subunit (PCNA family)